MLSIQQPLGILLRWRFCLGGTTSATDAPLRKFIAHRFGTSLGFVKYWVH